MELPVSPTGTPARRTCRRKNERGFTLLELLTSCAILTMLGVILAQIFGVTRDAFEVGSERTSMHKAAITAMDKITPKIVSANPDPSLGDAFGQTIMHPPSSGADSELRFLSSMDYFNGQSIDLVNPVYYPYRIVYDGNDIVFQVYAPNDVSYTGAVQSEQTMAFSNNEARIEALNFGVYGNDVEVNLRVGTTIRGATGQDRDVDYTLQNVTPVHYFSTKTTE